MSCNLLVRMESDSHLILSHTNTRCWGINKWGLPLTIPSPCYQHTTLSSAYRKDHSFPQKYLFSFSKSAFSPLLSSFTPFPPSAAMLPKPISSRYLESLPHDFLPWNVHLSLSPAWVSSACWIRTYFPPFYLIINMILPWLDLCPTTCWTV